MYLETLREDLRKLAPQPATGARGGPAQEADREFYPVEWTPNGSKTNLKTGTTRGGRSQVRTCTSRDIRDPFVRFMERIRVK